MPYLFYGNTNYFHAQNEPQVVIATSAKFNNRAIVEYVREVWNIKGVIHGTNNDTASTVAALVALEAAYSFNGFDLILYEDDQKTILHKLLTSPALGGTRVTSPPHYPIGDGAELSTFRNYAITVEADYPNTANNILDYYDTLELEGDGGPRYVNLETDAGQPQLQVTRQQTVYRARQQGRSEGLFDYAPVAPPIFQRPILQGAQTRIKFTSPKRVGNSKAYFVAEWSYFYESPVPIGGLPQQI
jgi:hypothetical protein